MYTHVYVCMCVLVHAYTHVYIVHVCTCACMSAIGLVYVCAGVLGGGRDVGHPRAGLSGGYELLGLKLRSSARVYMLLIPKPSL